jgi:hypothetical protein
VVAFGSMAKTDPAAEAMARLAALRNVDDLAALASGLDALLANKSSYVVARAAELVGERRVRGTLARIVETLDRMLRTPSIKDPGCAARFALAKAAVDLEAGYEAEEVMEIGVRHECWESIWGGSGDVAVSVRGTCAIGLAAMGSRLALRCATELLAEPDKKGPRERVSWPARQDAARALTMIGSDGAAAVLRFKALSGDPEPNVLSECLLGVIAIEGDAGLELAEGFLSGGGKNARAGMEVERQAEAALLAIGGSRRPAAFELLRRHERLFLHTASMTTFFNAIAMTRQEAAIGYLLKHVSEGSKDQSKVAAAALEPMRLLPSVGERLRSALAERKKSS